MGKNYKIIADESNEYVFAGDTHLGVYIEYPDGKRVFVDDVIINATNPKTKVADCTVYLGNLFTFYIKDDTLKSAFNIKKRKPIADQSAAEKLFESAKKVMQRRMHM